MDHKDVMLCMQHEFCTDCPLRANCKERVIFYNEEQFLEHLEESNRITDEFLALTGMPEKIALLSKLIFIEMISKKRNKELEEHPTYSPI